MALTFEELKSREDFKSVQTPERFGKKRNVFGKIAEFVAPTTFGLATREKKLTPRTAIGAIAEVGSFLIPAGAVARGFGLGAKGVIRGAQALKATKTVKPLGAVEQISRTRTQVGQVTRQVGRQTKRGAQVGGVSGALFGGGRALGEEDLTLGEVAKEAALTGIFGAFGGGVFGAVGSVGALSTRGVMRITSNTIKNSRRVMNPENAQAANQVLREGFEKSWLQGETSAIRNSLDKLMVAHRNKGGPGTIEGFFHELADHGLAPTPVGRLFSGKTLANTRPALDTASDKITQFAQQRSAILKTVKNKATTNSLKVRARALLEERTDADEAAFTMLERLLKSQLRGKTELTATELGEIVVRINKGRYTLAGNMLARASNNTIDTILPKEFTSVRTLNAEMSKYFRMKETLSLLNNKPIDVGFLSQALGRYGGLYAAGVLGAGLGPANPLFIAALFSQGGLRALSSYIAHGRFNPRLIDLAKRAINPDKKLKEKLLREATTKEQKDLLRKLLGEKVSNFGK